MNTAADMYDFPSSYTGETRKSYKGLEVYKWTQTRAGFVDCIREILRCCHQEGKCHFILINLNISD